MHCLYDTLTLKKPLCCFSFLLLTTSVWVFQGLLSDSAPYRYLRTLYNIWITWSLMSPPLVNNFIYIFEQFSYFSILIWPLFNFFSCFYFLGLDYLDEVPCNDLQAGPRYTCRLCHQTANMLEMVHHVIGRKHRQKYVVRHCKHFQTIAVEVFGCLLLFFIKKVF